MRGPLRAVAAPAKAAAGPAAAAAVSSACSRCCTCPGISGALCEVGVRAEVHARVPTLPQLCLITPCRCTCWRHSIYPQSCIMVCCSCCCPLACRTGGVVHASSTRSCRLLWALPVCFSCSCCKALGGCMVIAECRCWVAVPVLQALQHLEQPQPALWQAQLQVDCWQPVRGLNLCGTTTKGQFTSMNTSPTMLTPLHAHVLPHISCSMLCQWAFASCGLLCVHHTAPAHSYNPELLQPRAAATQSCYNLELLQALRLCGRTVPCLIQCMALLGA